MFQFFIFFCNGFVFLANVSYDIIEGCLLLDFGLTLLKNYIFCTKCFCRLVNDRESWRETAEAARQTFYDWFRELDMTFLINFSLVQSFLLLRKNNRVNIEPNLKSIGKTSRTCSTERLKWFIFWSKKKVQISPLNSKNIFIIRSHQDQKQDFGVLRTKSRSVIESLNKLKEKGWM